MNYYLGVDPGFAGAPTGAAFLEIDDRAPRLIDTLVFRPRAGGDWQRRTYDVLEQLKDWLAIELLPYYPPIVLCYELAWIGTNPQTALRMESLGGGVRGLAVGVGLECRGVAPVQSKLALAGRADATKQMMIDSARRIFGKDLTEHEADAVGHALAGEAELRRARVVREAARR